MNTNFSPVALLSALSPFSLRLTGILSALLLAFADLVGAQVAEPSTPSSSVVAKPLFALTPAKLVAPLQGAYGLRCLGSDPNGKFVIEARSEDQQQGPLFLVIDPKTGNPVKRIPTGTKPKETVEWTSESRWLPDGRFLYVGVTRGTLKDGDKSPAQGRVKVGVSLRLINAIAGTVSERLIPFDDPLGEGMSKGFCSWSGSGCVQGRVSEGRLLLSNGYFVAELDLASLKTLRSLTPPDIDGFRTPGDYLVKNGRLWEIQRNDGTKYFLTEFDKAPREINAEEFKRISESQKIENVLNTKTNEAKFFAREGQGRVGNDLISRDGAKLFVAYKKPKMMEVNLGATNTDCTTMVWQCGEYFLVDVFAPAVGNGPQPYRGLIAVASPED
jgi:hypothetical protein